MNRTTAMKAMTAAALTLASTASAGIPVYTDEASFLNDLLGPVATEGYESYTPNAIEGPRSIALDLFDVSYDGPSFFGVTDVVDIPTGLEPVDGTQHLRADFARSQVISLTFSFHTPVDAFGTYITDLEIAPLSVEVFLDNGQSFLAGDIDPTGNGGRTYFGIQPILVGIESIVFTMDAQVGIDTVLFDQTVATPAPGSAALLAAGLLATTRRRR